MTNDNKNKRYYWIKIKDSFLTSETVDFLMSQKDGANYIVIYQCLCLKCINTGGELSRQIGEVIIPFEVEKIARDLKWFSVDTIRIAIELYKKLGLIYEQENGILKISNFDNLVASETQSAVEKRNQRNKEKIGIDNVRDNVLENVYQDIRYKILDIKDNILEEDKKENIIINNNTKEKETKHKYGEYQRILLTSKEYDKLVDEFGKLIIDNQIKMLDEYVESNNNKNKYKNFNLILRKSIRDNWFKNKPNNLVNPYAPQKNTYNVNKEEDEGFF